MTSNSMILSKEETVVLMDILKLSRLPSALATLPTVSGSRYAQIAKAFYDTGALLRDKTGLRLDKGLARFLTPMEKAEQILLYRDGENGCCTGMLSIYFAKQGVVALRELDSEQLEFLRIDAAAELLLLLPALRPGSAGAYCSCWRFINESATAYVIKVAEDAVHIVEARRTLDQTQAQERQFDYTLTEYTAWWKNLLKEVYCVFNC